MGQGAFQRSLHGHSLHDFGGRGVHRLHIHVEEVIEGLLEHGSASAALFDEAFARFFHGHAVEDVLKRQVFMPPPFDFRHGRGKNALQFFSYHAPAS